MTHANPEPRNQPEPVRKSWLCQFPHLLCHDAWTHSACAQQPFVRTQTGLEATEDCPASLSTACKALTGSMTTIRADSMHHHPRPPIDRISRLCAMCATVSCVLCIWACLRFPSMQHLYGLRDPRSHFPRLATTLLHVKPFAGMRSF